MKFSTRTLKIFAVLFLSTIVWETFNIVGFWGILLNIPLIIIIDYIINKEDKLKEVCDE